MSLGFQVSFYLNLSIQLASRCLGSRNPESRWHRPHRCSPMVEQNDARCHRRSWYVCNFEFLILQSHIQAISLTGFNYDFNSLSTGSEKSELLKAFDTVFRAGTSPKIMPLMKVMVPPFRSLAGFFFVNTTSHR